MQLQPLLKRQLASYFSGKDPVYAVTLIAILGYLYGAEFLSWEPATLRMQLIEDVGPVDDKVMDKIQAAILAIADDTVYDDAVAFNSVATALYDEDVVPDEWDEPDVEEIAWAMAEIYLLRGESVDDLPISGEVKAYAQVVLKNEGFTKAPDTLEWADLSDADTRSETYSDDPTMFMSVAEEQDRKVTAVNRFVKDHTMLAIKQVQGLPFGTDWLDVKNVIES